MPPWVRPSGVIGELSSLNKLNRVASGERLGLTATISEIFAAYEYDETWIVFLVVYGLGMFG